MTSQLLSLDFEHGKTPSYMEPLDSSFSYMDTGLDYLQYPPQSPQFGVSLGLPQSTSPMAFNNLSLAGGLGDYTYSPSFAASSPARPYTPPDGVAISPPTLTYNLSGGEMSSDGAPSGRLSRGSGTHSPPASIPYAATVPRSHRFNPIAMPATRANVRAQRRRSTRSNDDSDDEDEEFQPASQQNATGNDSRRETIRKQRIESEQRRRDELRDGYARLKDTLPASNQKSSKVSLLDRATGHIRYLETVKDQLEIRLKAAEAEVHRLRNVNEALMLGTANQRAHAAGVSTSAF